MTLENSVIASVMIIVLVSGMDLVISSEMPDVTSIIVSGMDLAKASGIILGAKLIIKS